MDLTKEGDVDITNEVHVKINIKKYVKVIAQDNVDGEKLVLSNVKRFLKDVEKE